MSKYKKEDKRLTNVFRWMIFPIFLPHPLFESGQTWCHCVALEKSFPEWYGTFSNSSQFKSYGHFSTRHEDGLHGFCGAHHQAATGKPAAGLGGYIMLLWHHFDEKRGLLREKMCPLRENREKKPKSVKKFFKNQIKTSIFSSNPSSTHIQAINSKLKEEETISLRSISYIYDHLRLR